MSSQPIPPIVLEWYENHGMPEIPDLRLQQRLRCGGAEAAGLDTLEERLRKKHFIPMVNRGTSQRVTLFEPLFDSLYGKLVELGWELDDGGLNSSQIRAVSLQALDLQLTPAEKQVYWAAVQRGYVEDCVQLAPEIRLVHQKLRVHTRVPGEERELILQLLGLGYCFGEPDKPWRFNFVRIKGLTPKP